MHTEEVEKKLFRLVCGGISTKQQKKNNNELTEEWNK